ncbi:hypothetical protein QUC31_011488 [Theobroma cacao]|uniref:Uncharacterized protein n=1 Tax=Theobroma cacao TaxID=3641 RepID=A0A061ES41_THECC|nr:Uncharacterized protein TCM_021667 [Theobroma cacao]WRX22947.1 hypothetical protein QQP08_015434 [Theobroma cacao]
MKHDEEENPPRIYLAAYIIMIGAPKFFGLMWFSLSLFKMELKLPEENHAQTPLVLAIILYYGFAFGFLMPSIIVYGAGSLSLFFNYLWHGSDKAECKETGRFPVCFTAAASILCYILVPASWRLLKNFIGNLVKHPDANGALATALVLPFLLGFCIIQMLLSIPPNSDIEKKSSEIVKSSPNSDIDNIQPKS